jgi:DNA mismatch endonuclease (patch repair protein)
MERPTPSSDIVRTRMSQQKTRDTQPELAVRRLLHAAGLRYRIHRRPLPSLRREADIVFTKAKVAVFIDGCFWHGCPLHGTEPTANSSFWKHKITANQARDDDTNVRLGDAGWTVLRHWEHEDPVQVAMTVTEAVKNLPTTPSTPRSRRGGWPPEPPRSGSPW